MEGSFNMFFKDTVNGSLQVCSPLCGSNLHCTYTTESKGPFVLQPPPITPPPAHIFPIHIHKVIHTSLSYPLTTALLNMVKTLSSAAS